MDYQMVTRLMTAPDPEGAVRQYTVSYPSDSLASRFSRVLHIENHVLHHPLSPERNDHG